MKGPNPFTPWVEDPQALCGRKEEIRAFKAFLNAASSRQAGALLVRGGPGTGKTATLRRFEAEAAGEGMLTPFVKAERGEDERALARKIYLEAVAAAGGKAERAPESLADAAAAIEKAARDRFGAVVLIDDMDGMRKADSAVAAMLAALKAGWGKRKVAFVAACTRGLPGKSELLSRMELAPFGELEARELVEKALGKGPPKMGEECLQTLLADTGGNPKLIKSVCYHIYERLRDNEKVITKGHYLGYLPQIMGSLSREWFGGMYQATPGAEREILGLLARSDDGMHVSDIAVKLGKPLGPVTALTGRLMDSGQIVRVSRGRYRVFSRLYARFAAQRG